MVIHKKNEKITIEKPISLHPLLFEDALRAFLKTPPPKEEKLKETKNPSEKS